MPVQIDEVVVEPREHPSLQPRSEPGGGSQHGASPAPDPQLALTIAHAIALQRSRDLRLRAD